MRVSIIVAQASNRVIGRGNKLPWYLPEDLKYFKRVTRGKPIVMGRKTYESIGRPLPERTNIVITRNADWSANGVQVVHSLQAALELAEQQSYIDGGDEVVVIGGADIYAQALPLAQRIYLTQVHADLCGDAHFPALSHRQWHEVAREDFTAVEPNPYDYSFTVLERTEKQG